MKKFVDNYIALGFKPIPLNKNAKTPFVKGYMTMPVTALWADYDCNVGLQCGIGGLICFDADNATTDATLATLLTPYTPWIVKTRTGQHYWLRTDERTWPKAYRIMQGDYAGEIRLQNCQTLVPPSRLTAENYTDPTLGDWTYVTTSGSIEAVGYIPASTVELIITSLCDNNTKLTKPVKQPATPPQHIQQHDQPLLVKLPHIAWYEVKHLVTKFNWLKTATPGATLSVGTCNYPSRSEVFQSVVLALVRYGYSDDEVAKICIDENIVPDKRAKYYYIGLALTRAQSYIAASPVCQTLQALYHQPRTWRYTSDKLVYQYLIATGIQFDSFETTLNKQRVMVHTGIKRYSTIGVAIRRLEADGLIAVNGKRVKISESVTKTAVSKEMCLLTTNFVTLDIDALHIDLVAEKLLGKGTLVLNLLLEEANPLDIKTITALTGLSRRVVHRYLDKLKAYSLVLVNRHRYEVQTGWDYILYELASDAFNENYLRIQTEHARWQIIKDNQRIYGALNDIMSQPAALALIKRYETEQYMDNDLLTAMTKAKVAKPDFVMTWLNQQTVQFRQSPT